MMYLFWTKLGKKKNHNLQILGFRAGKHYWDTSNTSLSFSILENKSQT